MIRHPFRRRAETTALLAMALILAGFAPACRAPEATAPAPPADRHAPYDYTARNGMVVAAHPLAAEAGLEMLKSGGNAVDAAVATAFALNVAEPFASGIGGGGFMLIYVAETKRATVINYREKAPQAAYPEMFAEKGEDAEAYRRARGTAVAVPGSLAGWNLALERFGTRTLAQAAERAIAIAEEGFDIGETFSAISKEEYDRLFENGGETTPYLDGGLPFEPGDRFRNPELAATLRLVGERGIEVFYTGEIADQIVAAVREREGILTLDDLAAYTPDVLEPLRGGYKGYEIITAPPPATGGLHALQLLEIASEWPLREWGHNSAPYIHHLAEAFRFIFADKERYDGDPRFLDIPVDRLLSKEYASCVRAAISPDGIAGTYPYHPFDELGEKHESTTHVGVVDRHGNIVALTQSIQDFFGSGIVPEGTGFLLNDHMSDFTPNPESPNAPRPGRRPVSNMAPMIALKDGRPTLILGSPGGTRIFPSLAQIFLNVLEFEMPLDEAIEAPRFYTSSGGGRPRDLAVEPRIADDVLAALEALGHEIDRREPYDKYFGGAQGLLLPPGKKIIYGGADSRRDGVGAGY